MRAIREILRSAQDDNRASYFDDVRTVGTLVLQQGPQAITEGAVAIATPSFFIRLPTLS
jgi:hypothetical protein